MVTALMFETTSVEVCDALKKAFVTAWVAGAPRRQAPAASRDFKEINGAFIGYKGLEVSCRCVSNPAARPAACAGCGSGVRGKLFISVISKLFRHKSGNGISIEHG